MKFRKVVLAIVPIAVVAGVSVASAANLTLAAYLRADNLPEGRVYYDCETPGSTRGHIQAMAQALDSCGNQLLNGGRVVVSAQTGLGSSQSITFPSANYPGPCGQATQHRAFLQNHVVDTSNGTDTVVNYDTSALAVKSGCWNSTLNPAACQGHGNPWDLRISETTTGGACNIWRFQAFSLGSTN